MKCNKKLDARFVVLLSVALAAGEAHAGLKDAICGKFSGLGRAKAAAAAHDHQLIPASDVLDAMNRTLPSIENQAYHELERTPGTAGLIRFNEVIDEAVRKDEELPGALLTLATNRLPFLAKEPSVVFLSGGVADPWAPLFEKAAARRGMTIKVVKLPGSLSSARGANQKAVPAFPDELKTLLRDHPAVFFDDTYTNGGTAAAVREAVQKAGGKLDGVFVAYEGGKGDPGSLYKTGRNNRRDPSMGNFPSRPDGWGWAGGKPVRLAVETEGTLTSASDPSKLTLQGRTFLQELGKLGAEVQFLKVGKPVAAPSYASAIPGLKALGPRERASLAIGNWGREFRGSRPGRPPGGVDSYLETLRIGAYRDEGQLSEDLLDSHYFMNRLSEVGILEPHYARPARPAAAAPFPTAALDIRDLAPPTAARGSHNLAEIVQIADPKARVARLAKIQWGELTRGEREKMHELAPGLNNSFEIGQYIRIAGGSGDKRWVPQLTAWIKAWETPTAGWQKFVRAEAEKSLAAVEAHRGVELGEILKIEDPKARVGALSKIHWSELGDDDQDRIISLAPGLTNSFEIGQYIRIAGASSDERWLPQLDAWIEAWKNPTQRWQTFLQKDAEKAADSIRGIKSAEAPAPAAAAPAPVSRAAITEKAPEKIVEELLAKGESSEHPVLYLMAGGPGAGKNSVEGMLRNSGRIPSEKFVTIDADEIRAQLPGYAAAKASSPDDADRMFQSQATTVRTEAFNQALAKKKNIVRQGTLSDLAEAEGIIAQVEKDHPEYEIRVIHVRTDPEIALKRIEGRAAKDGRQVPASAVANRSARAAAVVEAIRDRVHQTTIIENNTRPRTVGRHIAKVERELELPPAPALDVAKDLHFKVLGADKPGTPLVLVHGLDSSGNTFAPVAEDLARSRPVIIYDQRGHGNSTAAGVNYSTTAMAGDLKALLDHLGYKKVHVLGHSMGGRTVAKFAELYPDRVDSVIIEDMELLRRSRPSAHTLAEYQKEADDLDARFVNRVFPSREALFEALKPIHGDETESIMKRRTQPNVDGTWTLLYRPGVSLRYGYQSNTEDLGPGLAKAGKPVLVLRADSEKAGAMTELGTELIEKEIPGARVETVKGADHVVHRKTKEEFMRLVEQFLAQPARHTN